MEASPPRRKQWLSSPEPAAEEATPSLDSLPPEILEKIVSCLRVRDAVRTSALSRAWRRRWESAPGLRFSWASSSSAPPDAIDDVLARYACPVRDFGYWEIPQWAFHHTDEWIPVLAGKGVQSLTLRFREYHRDEFYTLLLPRAHSPHTPLLLPPFRTLLFHCGFPKLTSLSLTKVGFDENGEKDLETMIYMSPLLETLVLRDVWILGDEFEEWVIQAPNLRKLTFVADDDYELQIGDLPSLEEVNVSIQTYYSDRDFADLLTLFAQVRVLEFHLPAAPVNILEGLSCSFQKLKSLVLHTDFCSMSRILSIFSLLRSAPNLQELEIKIADCETQNDEVDLDFFSALCTNCLFTKLKIVILSNAAFWSNEMHFIEFILSKARLLCALFVYRDESDYSKPSEEAVIQLTKFRRTSPKAKVFFRTFDDRTIRGMTIGGMDYSLDE